MKKQRIEVNFDKDTIKKLKVYAREHKLTLNQAGSQVLKRAIKAELAKKSQKDTHDWYLPGDTMYPFHVCSKCGMYKIAVYRNGDFKCKGNSIHVHATIKPILLRKAKPETTLSWIGKVRAWLHGLPCEQCKGQWSMSCRGRICRKTEEELFREMPDEGEPSE